MDSKKNLRKMKEDDESIDVKTKVPIIKMTNKDIANPVSKVKHNMTQNAKDITDYHESDIFTLKKLVDRIHKHSLMILGKKTKKHKKKPKKHKMIKKQKSIK